MTEARRNIIVPARERGMSLVVVTFVLIAVLAGGLAAVAIASAELSSTYGYRSRAVIDSCAQAAIEKVRAKLPDLTVADIGDSFPLPNGGTLTISGVHGSLQPTDSPLVDLPAGGFDTAAFSSGENVTNSLQVGAGRRLMTVVATCTGPGNSRQEIQLVLTYGVPTGE